MAPPLGADLGTGWRGESEAVAGYGLFKLNTDASVRMALRLIGLGNVIRDHLAVAVVAAAPYDS